MPHARQIIGLTALAIGLLASGCQDKGAGTPRGGTQPAGGHDESGHVHERGKMLIADAGVYHALLTAHLSTKGNELDIFFETTDKEPTPVALPVTSFKAYATPAGATEPKELLFEPAPADERPKDEKPGTCSHFVAKAPWLKAGEVLEQVVVPSLKGEEGTFRITWKNFDPKKYAHHEE